MGHGESEALLQLRVELDALCAAPPDSPATTLLVYPPSMFPSPDIAPSAAAAPEAPSGSKDAGAESGTMGTRESAEEEGEEIPVYCPNFEGPCDSRERGKEGGSG